MDWRMVLVVAMGCLAGGCFHSDAHRSGYTDDGKFWQVAKPEEQLGFLRPHIYPLQKPHPPIGVAGVSKNSTADLVGLRLGHDGRQ